MTRVVVTVPAWVRAVREPALRVAAENAYMGLAFAIDCGADTNESCARLIAKGREQLTRLEDPHLPVEQRVAAGQQAATAFGAARMMVSDEGTPPRV